MKRFIAAHAGLARAFWTGLMAVTASMPIATSAQAAVIHVPADVSSIQSAIASANPGDQVLVAPGTYFENINFLGKSVSVVSEAGAAVTFIDGGGAASVVVFRSSENASSVLDGFTLQRGYGSFESQYSGGGIYISGASPTIRNNIVARNNASTGSGIAVQFASPLITNNTVTENLGGDSAVYVGGSANARLIGNTIENNNGTGIELFAAGTPTVVGNRISGNTGNQGGGMTAYNYADAYVANNLIVGNRASQGGGVYFTVPSGSNGPTFVNNTVADNFANTGSDVYLGGFDSRVVMSNNIIATSAGSSGVVCDPLYQPASPQFSHNDVFSSNGATIAGSCAGLLASNGNISANPKFVGGGTGQDRYALVAGSPAIDAGENGAITNEPTDLTGNTRIIDGNNDGAAIVDLGAYEFASGSSVLPKISFLQAAEQTPRGDVRGRSSTDILIGFQQTTRTITVPFTVSGSDPALRYTVTPSTGTLTIPAGATSPARITVDVTYPAYLQCERSIILTLGTPSNASLGPITTNTLTVHNYAVPGLCKAAGR